MLLLFAYFTITVCECVLAAGQNRLPSAINKELIFFMCQSGDPRTAELKSRRPGCAAELIWLFYMFGDCLQVASLQLGPALRQEAEHFLTAATGGDGVL